MARLRARAFAAARRARRGVAAARDAGRPVAPGAAGGRAPRRALSKHAFVPCPRYAPCLSQELNFPSGIDPILLAAFTAGCNPPDAGPFTRTLLVSGMMTKAANGIVTVEESVGFKRKGKC